MIGLVRIALRRPYTFVVMAIVIVLVGVLAALKTPTDIFPAIRIPVISVVWSYTGMPPSDMSGRIVYYYERSLTTDVTDIEHIESQSLPGYGVVKIFFQPHVNINAALAEVTAVSQTVLKHLPAGVTPPDVLVFNASTVPILQLALSGKGLSQMKLYDMAQNFIRPQLATVPGAAVPSPYGGKVRRVQVDLNMQALEARGLSASDVVSAIAAQNLVLPAGTEKIGKFEYNVALNASPKLIDQLNDLPIKQVNGTIVYVRDVAYVHDGSPPQTNVVHVDGKPAVLMTILKSGNASTLNIINGVKSRLPLLKQTMPAALRVDVVGDQSVFVKAAVSGVIREGAIAAALTGLMILLFLGSWRSTLIITISIPLAVLTSIALLSALGETINVMTLGGLALAVGILVDDATVTIENINWHLEHGKEIEPAIMDGAKQIVVPAFVSLLCICIVFVPMFGLTGVARYLFVPMAEAVVFALMGSFILSRTLVPTMAKYLLKPHHHVHGEPHKRRSRNPLVLFQQGFERRFEGMRRVYRDVLLMALRNRIRFICGFMAVVVLSFLLVPFLGENFFPSVDAGQIKLHVRAQTGTRIEETSRLCGNIEQAIRRVIPASELGTIVDNIGLTVSNTNAAYDNSGTIGPEDADILVSLKPNHRPTALYVAALRMQLPKEFPGATFAFLPADIITQILNFGLPAPVDVQVVGPRQAQNFAYAQELLRKISRVPGIADPRIQQKFDAPQMNVKVNRSRAQDVGLTQRDVATSLLVALAGSGQTKPIFWLNPKNGVSYPVIVQAPQYRVDTLSDLEDLPITGHKAHQLLGAVASVSRGASAGVISHYDVAPVVDLFATVQGRDLGAVAGDIRQIIRQTKRDLPKGSVVALRGQVETMTTAYAQLYAGLAAAVVLIYLVIVVNFQSWLDPFVIITALPAALAGIVWMLFVTGTTLSVPALTGALMCMGVATANSILVVSFARERMEHQPDAVVAAMEAGFTRFRPVLMTALAMIIGMLPMALAMGEGGEQNAPLGRAVIGGLVCATIATLFFVPVVFSLVHGRKKTRSPGTAQPVAVALEAR